MRNPSFWWIIAGIMLLLDWYVFQSLKTVLQPQSERIRTFVFSLHWTLAVLTLLALLLFPYLTYLQQSHYPRKGNQVGRSFKEIATPFSFLTFQNTFFSQLQ